MKINRQDKKNILLTFAVSAILFTGLYIAATMAGISEGNIFSKLSAQSSDGAEILINNPLTEPSTFTVDGDKVKQWISIGAQPTDTVKSLLKNNGIID